MDRGRAIWHILGGTPGLGRPQEAWPRAINAGNTLRWLYTATEISEVQFEYVEERLTR